MNLFDFAQNAPVAPARSETPKDALKKAANQAYYQSEEPVLTDAEFDLLDSHGLDIDTRNFREKVAHSVAMGSLSKYTDAAALARWAAKYPGALLVVMPKLDGNSLALSYTHRQLRQAATRGDGTIGNNVTGNVLHTQVLHELPSHFPAEDADLRVEAIISLDHAHQFEKNLRNIVSGRLNAKDPQPEVLGLVEQIVFDVYGPTMRTWNDKRKALLAIPQKFRIAFEELDGFNAATLYDDLKTIYARWKAGPYAIDGLVVWAISDPDAELPAPSLDPQEKAAVKFGSRSVDTEVIGIDWNLGRHDRIVPTLLLRPVELDGTTVQRASASNFSLLKAAGMGIGAKVAVQKAGEIIPFIKTVHEPSQEGVDTLPPCPYCDTPSVLSASGVDALCPNTQCEGKIKVRLQKAFAIFGIDFVSDATIDKLVDAGFDSLDKIFALTVEELVRLDGFAEKSATYFVNALKQITLSEPLIIKLVGLRGIGERKGIMLLDHYGSLDAMVQSVRQRGLDPIPNFGPKQTEVLNRHIDEFETMLATMRSYGIRVEPYAKAAAAPEGGLMICCTGACPGYTRDQLASLLAQHGHTMLDDVTKTTQLLLCADPNSGSSKIKKASAKGIAIKSYGDFLKTLGA